MFIRKVIRTIVVSPILGVIVLSFLLGLLIYIISEEYGRLCIDRVTHRLEKYRKQLEEVKNARFHSKKHS